MELQLQMEVSFDAQTGMPEAAYWNVRSGRVFRSQELVVGVVFADYTPCGELKGIEILSPCDPALLQHVFSEQPESVRLFLESAAAACWSLLRRSETGGEGSQDGAIGM